MLRYEFQADESRVTEHHYGLLCEQMTPVAAVWEEIVLYLGFKDYEIANIRQSNAKYSNPPGSFMNEAISKWSNWAPGDSRGSKDYATIGALRRAVSKAGRPHDAETLTLGKHTAIVSWRGLVRAWNRDVPATSLPPEWQNGMDNSTAGIYPIP